MRQTLGFVAYYFLETDHGIATITITEDETGTQESMGRARRATARPSPRRPPRGRRR
jgi:hypothetical protein